MPTTMIELPLDNAPEASTAGLAETRTKYGFVPNLAATLANAPPVFEAYRQISSAYERTSLTPLERQVVLLAASVANRCEYCVAAHSIVARMLPESAGVVAAIRNDQPIAIERLEALRVLTVELVTHRGWADDETIARFLAAGYQPAQALEVILGVTLKTLTNYTNHLTGPALDPQFASQTWAASR